MRVFKALLLKDRQVDFFYIIAVDAKDAYEQAIRQKPRGSTLITVRKQRKAYHV